MNTPLGERAQRRNLRAVAAKAQRASERAGSRQHQDINAALLEAYADGIADVLLYITGDLAPGTWLRNILDETERVECP